MRDIRTLAVGFGAGLLGAVVGVAGMGAAQDKSEVRTRRLVIENDKGVPCAILGTLPDSSPQFALVGPNHRSRAMITLDKYGSPEIDLRDGDGASRLTMSVSTDGGVPILTLRNADKSRSVGMMVSETSGSLVEVKGKRGEKVLYAP